MPQVAPAPPSTEIWVSRRHRARQLLERHGFAAELFRLYAAVLEVQEHAYAQALDDRPDPTTVASYVSRRVMRDVARATIEAGPPALAEAVDARLGDGETSGLVSAWLAGAPQEPVDLYLGRAASAPVLEALGPAAAQACSGRSERGCPRCGGLPQVSYLTDAGEALVSGPRMLQCCRCGASWIYQRMTCAGCGESSTSRLPIFADLDRFPHLRADACETCRRYVITVDLRKDAEAVPIVDELAALPLDLDVQERGFTKIVPNLMAIG